MVHQSLYFARAMLAIAVDLDGDIVTMQGCIPIPGLHCPADAEVEGKTDDSCVRWHLPQCVIRRSIIDHQHIKLGQRALQAMSQLADGLSLVKSRDNHQAAQFRMNR